jgi:DNA-binding MarR family transcriptional regulator
VTHGTAEDETLADVFWAVARRMRHRSRRTAEEFGVTPGQARALGQLARHGDLRLSALSEWLRIAPRSGTEVVDALEERGLVRRSPDPDDRRATLVTLTPQGERVAAGLKAAQRAEAEAFFGTLSPADREVLARILTDLRATDAPPEPLAGGEHTASR